MEEIKRRVQVRAERTKIKREIDGRIGGEGKRNEGERQRESRIAVDDNVQP